MDAAHKTPVFSLKAASAAPDDYLRPLVPEEKFIPENYPRWLEGAVQHRGVWLLVHDEFRWGNDFK